MKKDLIKINTIVPTPKQISKSIKLLDKKVKQAIDIAIIEFINFTLFKI
jgi:hypothetical protein